MESEQVKKSRAETEAAPPPVRRLRGASPGSEVGGGGGGAKRKEGQKGQKGQKGKSRRPKWMQMAPASASLVGRVGGGAGEKYDRRMSLVSRA